MQEQRGDSLLPLPSQFCLHISSPEPKSSQAGLLGCAQSRSTGNQILLLFTGRRERTQRRHPPWSLKENVSPRRADGCGHFQIQILAFGDSGRERVGYQGWGLGRQQLPRDGVHALVICELRGTQTSRYILNHIRRKLFPFQFSFNSNYIKKKVFNRR